MDFTDAYRLAPSTSAHRSYAYSPGSTFFSTLHHIAEHGTTVIQVRVSTSLQVVRNWTMEFHATSADWSRDGSLLLVVGEAEFVVLAVDPSTSRKLAKDDSEGVVACVKVGMEGLSSACWVGCEGHEAVCSFSSDDVIANIYNVRNKSVFTIINLKRLKLFSSPSVQHLAFLLRQDAKDGLIIVASPTSRHNKFWATDEQFSLQTNDAVEVVWSPDEKYLAVREGPLEYKVQIYSPLGLLQSSFQIDSNVTQVQSSFVSVLDSNATTESEKVSGGGLGIRAMRWAPNSSLLAVGGYDQAVRILESREWSMGACLDLSKKVVADCEASKVMGPLTAWREPYDWKRETGGRGIVEYERVDTPFTLPSVRIDMSANSNFKTGIVWLEWNHNGSLLAVRNDNQPAAVYVYAFPPLDPREGDQRIQPYLLAVSMLSSSITLAAWKPVAADQVHLPDSSLAVINVEGQSIHLWSYQGGLSPRQVVEAIPIPIDDFQASDFAFAPDGNKILITSHDDTFCCAIEAGKGRHAA
ncbi:hypothetical protein CBS101457_000826 [Exobasidium rhododendri]|nr:hypothetical protein CBS101457_000826 [Exobasidium rhododendri]